MEFTDKSGAPATITQDENAFVLYIDGDTRAGHAEFRDKGGDRIFHHTEVDDAFEGRGLGSGLVREALSETRRQDKISVPVCPLVASVIEKDPEKYDGWFRRPSPSDLEWLREQA